MSDFSNLNGHSSSNAKKTVDFSLKIVRKKEDFTDPSLKYKPFIIPEIVEDNNDKILKETSEITLTFLSSTLTSHINVPNPQDPIYKELIDLIRVDYVNDSDAFLKLLDTESTFKPHGKLIKKFELEVKNQLKTFEVFVCDFENKEFREYQQRAELFALFFIDGANRLEEDEKWLFFTLFEKDPKTEQYHFTGYSSTYRFYAFPDKIRPRISQFVIIPAYQRNGLGKQLLLEIYNYYCDDPKAVEVTVEDPCEEFLKMRDILDAERILNLKLESFNAANLNYTKELCTKIHTMLKIPACRIRRLYEIVKLYYIRKCFAEDQTKMVQFRDELKKRLTLERMKEQQVMSRGERGRKVFNKTVAEASEAPINVEEDLKNLMSYYSEIVAKINVVES